MKKRLALANATFWKFSRIWSTRDLGRQTKVNLLKTLVMSILFYYPKDVKRGN